jgi:hypothetical protein
VGEPTRTVTLRGWFGRSLAALVGFTLVAYLVRGAGPGRVAHVLLQAGSWLPIILALELIQPASDVLALRLILREATHKVPLSSWIRSSAVAYAMMILLPAGRAAGELARATLLAKHVGARSAAAASITLSAAYLATNGLASAAAAGVVASLFGAGSPLALLLAGNAVVMGVSASGLVAVVRNARVGHLVERVRRFLLRTAPPLTSEPIARGEMPFRAMMACVLGRAAQLVQYGVVLAAVGGAVTVRGTFVAQGIHLVGASLGDLLPNQLGVVDGTYRTFAPDLGFAKAPERALGIAFVIHAAQLSLSAFCVVVASFMRPAAPRVRSEAGTSAKSQLPRGAD